MAVGYKGGRCSVCGYDRCINALEFHHLDPEVKDFGISDRGYTRSWNKIKRELEQCILLCSNCHKEVHAGLQLSRVIGIEKSGEFRESFVGGEATEAVRLKCLIPGMPTLSEACRRGIVVA
jgi:hypothetical protein